MAKSTEHIEIILAARAYNYQILHLLFASEPDKEMLGMVCGELTREIVGTLFDDDETAEDFCACLKGVEDELAKEDLVDKFVDDLRSAYTRLFIGPAKLAAPPWESIYTSKERALFQVETLEVRKAYNARGFLPADYPNVADDHLAIELNFMYHLANNTLESFTKKDSVETKLLISDQIAFLKKHLLLWSGQYVEAMAEAKADNAKTTVKTNPVAIYQTFARYMDFFVRADAAILKELAESI